MRKHEQGLFGLLGLGFYWSLWFGEPAGWVFGQELYPGELRLWGVLFRFLILLFANRVVVAAAGSEAGWLNLVWIGMYLALTLYQPKLELVTSAVVLALLCLGSSKPSSALPSAELTAVEPRAPALPVRVRPVSGGSARRRRSKSPSNSQRRSSSPTSTTASQTVVAAAKKKAMEEQEHRLQEKVQRLRL